MQSDRSISSGRHSSFVARKLVAAGNGDRVRCRYLKTLLEVLSSKNVNLHSRLKIKNKTDPLHLSVFHRFSRVRLKSEKLAFSS